MTTTVGQANLPSVGDSKAFKNGAATLTGGLATSLVCSILSSVCRLPANQDPSCAVGGQGWSTYLPVDVANGGRATGVDACITPDMLGTGSSTDISRYDVPGYQWARQYARYLGLDPRTAINACHLLADQLGGDGTDLANLATCSANRANVDSGSMPGMRSFETGVRGAVERGQYVHYSVIAEYSGQRTVPYGFLMTAEGTNQYGIPGYFNLAFIANNIYSPRYGWTNLGTVKDSRTQQPVPVGQ